MIQREHTLQAFAVKFFRAAIPFAHEFLSFDRSKPPGRSREAQLGAMARQKARGVKRGTPDSLLIVSGLPPFWIEWKDKGKRPDAEQIAMGQRLRILGCRWEWFDNLPDAWRWLADEGVIFAPNANVLALQYQGMVDAAIARKAPRAAPKKPARKAMSRAAMARLQRAGLVV